MVIPTLHYDKCKSGRVDHIDALYAMLDRPKQVKRSVQSPTTTLGTHIHNTLDFAGVYVTSSGDCRRFIQSLNRRHDLTADQITDRLVQELDQRINTWSNHIVPVNRDFIAGVVAQAIFDAESGNEQPVSAAATPDVSTLGTRLLAAIELAGEYKITCGNCRTFLLSLNKSTGHDPEQITERLLKEFQTSPKIDTEARKISDLRVWMRVIVDRVIAEEALGPS